MTRGTWALILSILSEGIADIFGQEYAFHGGWLRWVIALWWYILVPIFWLIALRAGVGLTRGANIFFVSSGIVAAIVGIGMYKESLTSLQTIGVILGIVSVGFMVWK